MTVTVYTPSVPEQDRFDVAEAPKVTLAGLREHDSPVEGEIAEARLTVPVRPPRLVTVIVELAVAPGCTRADVGDAEMVKSGV